LRLSVVRLHGHVFGDKQPYKPADFIAAEEARDPVQRLKAYLPDLDWAALEREVERSIRAALAAAQQQGEPEVAQTTRHVFYEGAPQKVGGVLPEINAGRVAALPAGSPIPAPNPSLRLNFVQTLNRVLETELTHNPRLMVFGEDVGPRGGVHRVTLDLQNKFGEARVFDTSLSEEGIVGRALGLAFAGLVPAPEIQFRKYADPATEQINDCGWVRWRTNNAFAAPMVVRMPVGYSKKTGDPWHSVTGEAIYAHTLGWRVAFPANATDAAGLLRAALRGNDPTIFLEHRVLLQDAVVYPYAGDEFVLPFGVANVIQPGDALTVVTWGAMVERCRAAARQWPNAVEILDLRTIIPWDKTRVLESVRKTSKCLIVHEDTYTGGFASEISATLAETAFGDLDAPIARLATPDCPIPYNAQMMRAVIPSAEGIANKIAELLAF
jgi:2-oxoisovalerate dehydrogenase E1 component